MATLVIPDYLVGAAAVVHGQASQFRLDLARTSEEGQPPQRVRGNLHLVRPMDAPAPFADLDAEEQIVIRAKRRKGGVIRDMLRYVDNGLRTAFPGDDERAALVGANRPNIRHVALHDRRYRRAARTPAARARTSARTASTRPGAALPSGARWSASRWTRAEPTTAASAARATEAACSGVLTPKPTAIGRSVKRRSRMTAAATESVSAGRVPVMPAIAT